MKKIYTLIVSLLAFGSCAAEVTDPRSIVEQTVTQFMAQHAIPGMAVEVYADGKPQSYYFGFADDAKKIPVTKQTIFEIASISKVMTSILLAQEFDAAKMQLNASVKTYLPQLPEDFDDITLQNLATHTSGLPFKPTEDIKTQGELDTYLANWYPDYVAGEEWIYSNLGIGLLGDAIQKTTHKTVDELYHKQIFSILGMQSSGMSVPKSLQKFYAQGHDENGQLITPVTEGMFYPAWAVKTSAQDMQKFLRAAIGLPGTPETILYPMRLTQAMHVRLAGHMMQGLGWQMHSITHPAEAGMLLKTPQDMMKPIAVQEVYAKPVFKGDRLIEKTGSNEGYSAYIAVIPNKKAGIVLLLNKKQIKNSEVLLLGRELLFKLAHVDAVESEDVGDGHA